MIFNPFRKKSNPSGKASRAKRGNLGPSIITSDVVIDGNLISNGELQIDGEVNGHVSARAAVIDINGIIHGEVVAEDVIVRGRIIGPIRAVHVHILNGAHVQGDVRNETISIENGAFIDGKIHRVENPLNEAYSEPEVPTASSYAQPDQSFGYDEPANPPYAPNGTGAKPRSE